MAKFLAAFWDVVIWVFQKLMAWVLVAGDFDLEGDMDHASQALKL